MTLDRKAKLFIGFKLEGRFRDAFNRVAHQGYVGQDGAGKYLTTIDVEGATYLGKVVNPGLTTDRIDDVSRNVLSIVSRLMVGERGPTALAIFPVVEQAPESNPAGGAS
jgi:hypothetical protein